MTLTLNLGGIAFALFFGIPLGVLSAVKRGRPLDRGAVAFTIFFGNAPAFVISLVGLYVFGLKLGWVPLFGDGTTAIGDRLHHLILPILVLGIAGMALIMRITRAAMIDQLDQDYIVFARARGLTSRRVIAFYAFRNALIPVLTAAGLLLIGVLTGAPFVETVFGLPGLGSLLVDFGTERRHPSHPRPRAHRRCLDHHREHSDRHRLRRHRSASRIREGSSVTSVQAEAIREASQLAAPERRSRLRQASDVPITIWLAFGFLATVTLMATVGHWIFPRLTERAKPTRKRDTSDQRALARHRRAWTRHLRPNDQQDHEPPSSDHSSSQSAA